MEDWMKYSIAFILGWIIARMMGEGFSVGAKKKHRPPSCERRKQECNANCQKQMIQCPDSKYVDNDDQLELGLSGVVNCKCYGLPKFDGGTWHQNPHSGPCLSESDANNYNKRFTPGSYRSLNNPGICVNPNNNMKHDGCTDWYDEDNRRYCNGMIDSSSTMRHFNQSFKRLIPVTLKKGDYVPIYN